MQLINALYYNVTSIKDWVILILLTPDRNLRCTYTTLVGTVLYLSLYINRLVEVEVLLPRSRLNRTLFRVVNQDDYLG